MFYSLSWPVAYLFQSVEQLQRECSILFLSFKLPLIIFINRFWWFHFIVLLLALFSLLDVFSVTSSSSCLQSTCVLSDVCVNECYILISARECPNLCCLNLADFSLSLHGISLLKPIGASLRRLVLESIGCPKDPHLKLFFESCPHLTSVVLSSNSHLTGECLRGLNSETLEELIIDSCNGLRPVVFGEVLATFKNLQRLSMNSCISLTSGILDNVFKSLPQLKSLSLGLHFPLLKSSSFKAISHLTNLVTLTVFQNSSINDDVMKVISKNCKKIEFLDITGKLFYYYKNTCTR